ncbi:MAG: DsbA family protein [Thermoflexales bacterium]|nr:DsbA family protein [Thermoflexales bacterium]MDW8351950.1 thioredoxin domain-containing protein [Anaerolineae bacterium]
MPPLQEYPSRSDRRAFGWFMLGAVFGALVAVGAMLVITAARTPSRAQQQAAQPQPATQAALATPQQQTAQAQATPEQPTAQPQADTGMVLSDPQPFLPKVEVRPSNTQGDATARVTIVEYSDFNCGFCRRFYAETLSRILDEYVRTGKARFSYKHYPFLAESSVWKAQAAECAAEQGRFWDYHSLLFTRNIFGNDQASMRQALTAAAGDIGLRTDVFADCLSREDALRRVQADAEEARRLGVSGTPSFLINGRPLVGAQPYEAFRAMIEEELAKAPAKP